MTGTSDSELIKFLADPDNVSDFIGVAITQSLGFSLTEDGQWVRLYT
jgi:hypothetical protein